MNMNLAAVVRHYLANHGAHAAAELDSFRREATLASAVARATLAETPEGRRYSHQHRLAPATLTDTRDVLLKKLDEVAATTSFAKFHQLLQTALGSRAGVGELYLYDTALRIGAKLGFLPKAVYLHAGTREGARALGLDAKARLIHPFELPMPLRELEPHQVEDILCIYKKHLAGEVRDLDESRACWVDEDGE